jgi:hypothetical protein
MTVLQFKEILMTRFLILILLAVALFNVSGVAGELSGFRGDGAGLYPRATPPTSWSPESNVVWKTEMPDWSNASPLTRGSVMHVFA